MLVAVPPAVACLSGSTAHQQCVFEGFNATQTRLAEAALGSIAECVCTKLRVAVTQLIVVKATLCLYVVMWVGTDGTNHCNSKKGAAWPM
jgi:hypothetical protein